MKRKSLTPFTLRASKTPPDPPAPKREQPDTGDDIPDTPPDEPKPIPIRDPKPPGQPRGPFIA
jgi:hypothetical protein